MANTLAALANMILLYGYLQKNLQALRIRSVAKTFGKSLVATLIMSVVVLALTAKTSSWAAGSVKGLLFHVGLASSVGAAVYFAVVLFLQIEEGKWLLKRLTKKV